MKWFHYLALMSHPQFAYQSLSGEMQFYTKKKTTDKIGKAQLFIA